MKDNYLESLRKKVGAAPLVVAGVSTIIVNEDNHVLFVSRKDNGLWGLPAGSVELKESPQTAAVREIAEETGLIVDPSDLALVNVFGGESFFYTYPNGDQCSFVVSLFACTIFSGNIKTSTTETEECTFFSIEDFPRNIADHESLMLQEYVNRKKSS